MKRNPIPKSKRGSNRYSMDKRMQEMEEKIDLLESSLKLLQDEIGGIDENLHIGRPR